MHAAHVTHNMPAYSPARTSIGASPRRTSVLGIKENIAAGLCYMFWPLQVLFLFTEPRESRLIRFHAAQIFAVGGYVTLVWILSAILAMVGTYVGAVVLKLGDPAVLVAAAIGIVPVVVTLGASIRFVVGMVRAFQGRVYLMPPVGKRVARWAGVDA